tara:strand:+ start:414 stop:1088 length:675 start_codon:yes stop_codon:yes gene_type:complete
MFPNLSGLRLRAACCPSAPAPAGATFAASAVRATSVQGEATHGPEVADVGAREKEADADANREKAAKDLAIKQQVAAADAEADAEARADEAKGTGAEAEAEARRRWRNRYKQAMEAYRAADAASDHPELLSDDDLELLSDDELGLGEQPARPPPRNGDPSDWVAALQRAVDADPDRVERPAQPLPRYGGRGDGGVASALALAMRNASRRRDDDYKEWSDDDWDD